MFRWDVISVIDVPIEPITSTTAASASRVWFESPSGRDIFCLKNFDTSSRTFVRVSKTGTYIFITGPLCAWWRHQMETFSALLAICAGNSPVPGDFPTQRPVTRSFEVYFDLCPNKRLSKQLWDWWFETQSWPLIRHCNECVIEVQCDRWILFKYCRKRFHVMPSLYNKTYKTLDTYVPQEFTFETADQYLCHHKKTLRHYELKWMITVGWVLAEQPEAFLLTRKRHRKPLMIYRAVAEVTLKGLLQLRLFYVIYILVNIPH